MENESWLFGGAAVPDALLRLPVAVRANSSPQRTAAFIVKCLARGQGVEVQAAGPAAETALLVLSWVSVLLRCPLPGRLAVERMGTGRGVRVLAQVDPEGDVVEAARASVERGRARRSEGVRPHPPVATAESEI